MERLSKGKHSRLLGPFLSYKENEVLSTWPLVRKYWTRVEVGSSKNTLAYYTAVLITALNCFIQEALK
jgi:hypothetical protein